MRKQNIGVQLHYYPVYLHPYYQKIGFKGMKLTNAEKYAQTNLSIPIYPGLKINQINRVSSSLEKSLEFAGLI